MMMDDIIEISSSSPERNPRSTPARLRRPLPRRTPSFLREGDVIDITSDEDEPIRKDASSALKNNRIIPLPQSQAGPSRLGVQNRTPGGSSQGVHRSFTLGSRPYNNSSAPYHTPPRRAPDLAPPSPPPSSGNSFAPDHGSFASQKLSPEPEVAAAAPVHEVISRAASPLHELRPVVESVDTYVARVLEILPDALPDHIHDLVCINLPEFQHQVVQRVMHLLFENPSYPKVDPKGKRKAPEEPEPRPPEKVSKPRIDYRSKDRPYTGGPDYHELALDQLTLDFPYIPKAYVRRTLLKNNCFYAPAYLVLAEEQTRAVLPYVKKTQATRVTGKGKARQSVEFEAERQWILRGAHDADEDTVQDQGTTQAAEDADEEGDEECEDGIQCGCCFSSYAFDRMIQCPEAHLFCKSCMRTYASTKLGEHDINIVCMDQSNCRLLFPETELQRFLTPKLWALYERIKQRKDIEAAGLEGLEECPFCDYKVVIENAFEKLFRCENSVCGAVSCRQCKKLDHLPKSCKEAEEDRGLDGRHAIEEAMTRALLRNCPKCSKSFIKDVGCNKMTCPNCQTISCYLCRQIINGYDHFNDAGRTSSPTRKCILWDSVEERHVTEVKAAAQQALEQYKRSHPDVREQDLQVDLPPNPRPAPGPLIAPPAPWVPRVVLDAVAMAQPFRRNPAIMRDGPRIQPEHLIPVPYVYNQPPVPPNYAPGYLNMNLGNAAAPAPAPPVFHFAAPPPLLPPPPAVPRARRAPRRKR